jgi:hypothetical protein
MSPIVMQRRNSSKMPRVYDITSLSRVKQEAGAHDGSRP